jgi:hypothetical protein
MFYSRDTRATDQSLGAKHLYLEYAHWLFGGRRPTGIRFLLHEKLLPGMKKLKARNR